MATSANIFSPSERQACIEVVKILQQEKLLAVDCEGIQLGKDGPLTLLQIGTLDGEVYLFDVMQNEKEQDKNFFKDIGLDELLTSSEIVKVIHSCSRDSAALFHQFEINLKNVFDTQVAHLVIEEHKGNRLSLREKLEDICNKYSTLAIVYERKDTVQNAFVKKEGNFWAKRPLTQKMIDSTRDVAALIQEVYDNQKRYLEENGLMDKFFERVQEEIGLEIDAVNKERRQDRHNLIKEEILTSMCEKYGEGTKIADLSNDEKRSLNETAMKDILSAKYPDVVRELKLESHAEFLKSLEVELNDPDNFIPKPYMMIKLNEIVRHRSKTMKKDVARIKKQFIETVLDNIERKYDVNTPLTHLSQVELHYLTKLRPLYDDKPYQKIVLALYWRIVEADLDEDMEKLASDPEYEVQNVQKLIRFILDVRVPINIKSKAQEVRKLNEDVVIERLPHKYDADSSVDELTDAEKIVLERLNVIDNDYGPVIEFLHWEVTFSVLCKDFKDFKSGKFKGKNYISRKLDFLSTNERVPEKTKQKAREFQKEISQGKGRGKKHRK